ncbi:MAG TPA: hypothetical protein VFZ20_08540 [Longimicrobium sp.]|nr:hypothetical protein [Longimicrobium sp.]
MPTRKDGRQQRHTPEGRMNVKLVVAVLVFAVLFLVMPTLMAG